MKKLALSALVAGAMFFGACNNEGTSGNDAQSSEHTLGERLDAALDTVKKVGKEVEESKTKLEEAKDGIKAGAKAAKEEVSEASKAVATDVKNAAKKVGEKIDETAKDVKESLKK